MKTLNSKKQYCCCKTLLMISIALMPLIAMICPPNAHAEYFFPDSGSRVEEIDFSVKADDCSVHFALPYQAMPRQFDFSSSKVIGLASNNMRIFAAGPKNLADCALNANSQLQCDVFFTSNESTSDWSLALAQWQMAAPVCRMISDGFNVKIASHSLFSALGMSSCDPDGVLTLDAEKTERVSSCYLKLKNETELDKK